MPLSDDLKLIFVHIPKNAGTSIYKTYFDDGGGRGRFFGHHNWSKYHRDVPEKWNRYTTFSVVRNVWDRVVSSYKYSKKEISFWHNAKNPEQSEMGKHPDYDVLKNKSFSEAVDMLNKLEHQGWDCQYPYICDEDQNIMVDRILKMENLESELNEMLKDLGEERKISLQEKNVTREEKDYCKWYGKEERKKVEEYYKTDIELFNYSF